MASKKLSYEIKYIIATWLENPQELMDMSAALTVQDRLSNAEELASLMIEQSLGKRFPKARQKDITRFVSGYLQAMHRRAVSHTERDSMIMLADSYTEQKKPKAAWLSKKDSTEDIEHLPH